MSHARPAHGILFDSGDTLVQPLGGAWFPGHQFRDVLRQHDADNLAWERLEAAIGAGAGYLDANYALLSEQEEHRQFIEFYCLAPIEMRLTAPEPALLHDLALAIVDPPNFAFFPDVVPALAELRARELRLGILSNAWPSLERKYALLGARQFFDTFVISARLGCTKPDARMFDAGLAGLGLTPDDALFVDDVPEYVAAAVELGMRGAVMDRTGTQETAGLPRATCMAEVLALVG